ncbi:MAG: diguanylate cyclase [Acidimicrobiales bacterium]
MTGSPTESSGYYRDVVEAAPDALLVVDHHGTIELVNRQAEVLFGYPRDELIGQPVELLVPDRAKAVHPSRRAWYFAHPRTRPMGAGLDLTAQRKDATEVPVDISLSPLETERGMVVAVAIRDVTERKQAERELRDAYGRLSASVRDLERHDRDMTVINEMGDLLQSCITEAEANQIISRYGRRLFPSGTGAVFRWVASAGVFETAASWGQAEHVPAVVERGDCWALRRARAYAVEGLDDGPNCPHVGLQRKHGCICVPMMAQGEALGLLHLQLPRGDPDHGAPFESQRTLALTVAEQLSLALANLSLRETLRHQSVSDALTGLYNRRYIQDFLTRELHRADRTHAPLSVVLADVDNLKMLNDLLGHGAGDAVLRSVARALEGSVRGNDAVCRYGGDEFVLVLPGSPLAVAQRRAEQLRDAVRRLDHADDARLQPITLSLGVAAFPDHGATAEELLASADDAMYRAKQQGRNRVAQAPV